MLTVDLDKLALAPGTVCVDVGCGEGRHTLATYLIDGGQAPFTIWQLATQSGLFEPLGTEDTLRGLRRLGR